MKNICSKKKKKIPNDDFEKILETMELKWLLIRIVWMFSCVEYWEYYVYLCTGMWVSEYNMSINIRWIMGKIIECV